MRALRSACIMRQHDLFYLSVISTMQSHPTLPRLSRKYLPKCRNIFILPRRSRESRLSYLKNSHSHWTRSGVTESSCISTVCSEGETYGGDRHCSPSQDVKANIRHLRPLIYWSRNNLSECRDHFEVLKCPLRVRDCWTKSRLSPEACWNHKSIVHSYKNNSSADKGGKVILRSYTH